MKDLFAGLISATVGVVVIAAVLFLLYGVAVSFN